MTDGSSNNSFEGVSCPEVREIAIFAGGCFWCTEAVFEMLKGVIRVESGYIGGNLSDNVTYEAVCSGETGHAEAVRVEFDPSRLTYRELLGVFFATHDPTQLNRQGNDVGSQYRSAIFCCNESQLVEAQRFAAALEADARFDAPVLTEIQRAGRFHPAEALHRGYYRRNPEQAYCAHVISPKLAKFRRLYSQLLQEA